MTWPLFFEIYNKYRFDTFPKLPTLELPEEIPLSELNTTNEQKYQDSSQEDGTS